MKSVVRGGEPNAVAPDEAPGAVTRGLAARLDRVAGQVAAQVVGQGLYRAVTLLGFLSQRLEYDGVQIAPQGLDRAGPFTARGGRRWRLRVVPQHRRLQLVEAPAAAGEGKSAGKQLVEHHAELVDIGERGDRLAADLLGGVIHRCPVRVRGVPAASVWDSSSLASPKSRSFTVPPWSTRMFEGLRSRCTTRLRWAYWVASQTVRKSSSR
jgi:hypothetical protein